MFYMFLAEGFEEVEAIAALDVIRRGEIEIETVSLEEKSVTGSHGITLIADMILSDAAADDTLEGVVLPGGMPGTLNLQKNESVNNLIDFCYNNNRFVCAICAAPMILGKKGILSGKKATCFPGFEKDLLGAEISGKYVCTDGKIITGRGMGSAVKFGLAVVAAVKGGAYADKLEATLQCS